MIILASAMIRLPFLISSKVSKLKVENVLNPPQNPITISGFKKSDDSILFEKVNMVSPKIMQLKTFAVNVPSGNSLLYSLETPYLLRLPKPPPINIATRVIMYYLDNTFGILK